MFVRVLVVHAVPLVSVRTLSAIVRKVERVADLTQMTRTMQLAVETRATGTIVTLAHVDPALAVAEPSGELRR